MLHADEAETGALRKNLRELVHGPNNGFFLNNLFCAAADGHHEPGGATTLVFLDNGQCDAGNPAGSGRDDASQRNAEAVGFWHGYFDGLCELEAGVSERLQLLAQPSSAAGQGSTGNGNSSINFVSMFEAATRHEPMAPLLSARRMKAMAMRVQRAAAESKGCSTDLEKFHDGVVRVVWSHYESDRSGTQAATTHRPDNHLSRRIAQVLPAL